MEKQYAVGIDLGTTNSVMAYVELAAENLPIQLVHVPQIVAANTVEAQAALPSFLYLPTAQQLQSGSFALPWQEHPTASCGHFARQQAADAPMRTVAAAKSWLAHSRVDRRSPILPQNAPDEVERISPVAATRHYLAHLVATWNQAFPAAPLHHQHVVLTVPASFDASARELTREAAHSAGLPEGFTLLEEPQAAVYAWLHDTGEAWRQQLSQGDILLVCDIGGGTTDFTLIEVDAEEGDLVLKRIAVGDHILVGGDNMDLTLAHLAAEAFAAQNVQIDPWQSVALWHACRAAKENLLATSGPEKEQVSILGRGSKLIGGTLSQELDRGQVAATLVEGFFPRCPADAKPARSAVSGFRELGLPFEADTGITRHLALFLSRHGGDAGPIQPTHLLFNGGVFKSAMLRQRLVETMSTWSEHPPQLLAGNQDLDFAVARGAAYYGATKVGGGMRIRGGAARAYYVGIERAGLAVPGAPRPLSALCVVPYGMEEGTEAEIEGVEVGLVVGETAHFRFSSSVRKEDPLGAALTSWSQDELVETDSLEASLPANQALEDDFVPVRFRSHITELGVFELWCTSAISEDRWKLEFSVRQ